MAKRYRYSFTKRKQAGRGKMAIVFGLLSVVAFLAAISSQVFGLGAAIHLPGALCLFGTLLSAYGFLAGLISFRERDREHFTSIMGSILCGVILIIWLALYLSGVSYGGMDMGAL